MFCMCLCHPVYIQVYLYSYTNTVTFLIIEFFFQLCDTRIMKGHKGILEKWGGRSEITAQMVSEEVVMSVTGENEWSIRFDKEPAKVRYMHNHQ